MDELPWYRVIVDVKSPGLRRSGPQHACKTPLRLGRRGVHKVKERALAHSLLLWTGLPNELHATHVRVVASDPGRLDTTAAAVVEARLGL
jgi:hypothetical protein